MNGDDYVKPPLEPGQLDMPGTDYAERQALNLTREFLMGPSLYPLDGSERLRIWTAQSITTAFPVVTARILNRAGRVQRLVRSIAQGAGNRAVNSIDFELGEGFLLDVTIRAAGTVIAGQIWALAELIVGLGGEKQTSVTLAQGYVTVNSPAWGPGGPSLGSLDGQGAIRSVAGTTPAAGAELSDTVPTGARWELIAIVATLTTSAVVANRTPVLLLDDGANVVWRVGSAQTQAASTTESYSFGQGTARSGTNPSAVVDILPNRGALLAGWRIRTLTAGIDVGDQYSAIRYWVREWLEL
jgi:hypothetical protein